MNTSIKRESEQIMAQDDEPTFKPGDEVDCFVENGSEKEWIPAIFYAKAFHEKRPWKECYVVAYKNTGNVDIVTEIRKPDPKGIEQQELPHHVVKFRIEELENKIDYLMMEIEAIKEGKEIK